MLKRRSATEPATSSSSVRRAAIGWSRSTAMIAARASSPSDIGSVGSPAVRTTSATLVVGRWACGT